MKYAGKKIQLKNWNWLKYFPNYHKSKFATKLSSYLHLLSIYIYLTHAMLDINFRNHNKEHNSAKYMI